MASYYTRSRRRQFRYRYNFHPPIDTCPGERVEQRKEHRLRDHTLRQRTADIFPATLIQVNARLQVSQPSPYVFNDRWQRRACRRAALVTVSLRRLPAITIGERLSGTPSAVCTDMLLRGWRHNGIGMTSTRHCQICLSRLLLLHISCTALLRASRWRMMVRCCSYKSSDGRNRYVTVSGAKVACRAFRTQSYRMRHVSKTGDITPADYRVNTTKFSVGISTAPDSSLLVLLR